MGFNFQVLLVEKIHYRHMAKETNGSLWLFSYVGLWAQECIVLGCDFGGFDCELVGAPGRSVQRSQHGSSQDCLWGQPSAVWRQPWVSATLDVSMCGLHYSFHVPTHGRTLHVFVCPSDLSMCMCATSQERESELDGWPDRTQESEVTTIRRGPI